MRSTAFTCTYHLTLPCEDLPRIEAIAQQIANGQTLGTQDPALLSRLADYCAQVCAIQPVQPATPLPGHETVAITIEFPTATGVTELGALMAMAFGKISMAGRIRWHKLAVSPSMAHHLPGPHQGMEGIRQQLHLSGVDQPLLMAILKPCLGLSPAELADLLATQAEAGTHLIKDDEILADPTLDRALRRLEAMQPALAVAQQRWGRPLLYALNLNGPAHQLLDRAEALLAAGANAFLFNYLAYGLPTLASLSQQVAGRAVILGHPALGGAFYGSPWHGVSPSLVFGTLPRLAGADGVLFPSPYGKVCLPRADALAIHQALMEPELPVRPAFGVPSAGIQAEMVARIREDFGSAVIINAGTGIFDYPQGPVAGARAFLDQFKKKNSFNSPPAIMRNRACCERWDQLQ